MSRASERGDRPILRPWTAQKWGWSVHANCEIGGTWSSATCTCPRARADTGRWWSPAPMTSVKEQVTGVYARALVRRGFAALAIDPRHFGESGGAPRQYEHCGHKIADHRAALGFLGRHPAIDGARLGMVGVCLGAGYAAWTAVDSPPAPGVPRSM